MGKATGFLEFERRDRVYRPVAERIRHFREFVEPLADSELRAQGGRCMDCGIPYCHQGCPVDNIIPDWNDLVFRGDWKRALEVLHSTNNFPEFTGRICPAPCEEACTLNIQDVPVTIKTIECAIADRGWEEGWITPQPPAARTGRTVAVVGSGPAGLAAAQQLARAGHAVTVFEKNERPGGLLRFGIPDFKMEKSHIDRRIEQMEEEGVTFRCGVHVGRDEAAATVAGQFDAVLLTGGAEHPRDLEVPGRDLDGVHFAMDFLTQQNRRVAGAGEGAAGAAEILADGKQVIVIGGGDTGSDCIGTSFRQGARSVTQLEILPMPPAHPDKGATWPHWPLRLRTSSSQAEGAGRDWSVQTRALYGTGGRVQGLQCVRVDDAFQPVPGSGFELEADLVLLAMGFLGPVRDGMVAEWDLELDARGNVRADTENYRSSRANVFAAGDMRRGQSLVVWAIREGRQAARSIDLHLMGKTDLPR